MTDASTTQSATAFSIVGSGEMADRIRSFPWESSPLGPIQDWPSELIVMVNMMLSTDQLAGVFWGQERTFLYNDAYISVLTDKHPALGIPLWKIWPEIAEESTELIETPVRTGRAFVTGALPFKLLQNGVLQQTYFSIIGSPIFSKIDGRLKVGGAYFTYVDETASVIQARLLAETQARESKVLASIGDAVIVTDAHGFILTMNSVAEQLTMWKEDDSKGRSMDEVFRIVNEETRASVVSPWTRVRDTGLVADMASHTILIGKDGRETDIDDSAAPIRNESGELIGMVMVFRDVSERRALERERQNTADVQGFLLKLTDAQREAADARTVMKLAAEMLGRHLNAGRVGFSEPTNDRKGMQFLTGWVQDGIELLTGSVPLNHWGETTSTDFLRGRTVVYRDVHEEPSLALEIKNYESMGAVSVLAVPFLRRGVWKGNLYLTHPEPRDWSAQEIALAEQVAQRTAEAVEREQAEEDLRALAERLGMAQQAGQMASWQWDFASDTLVWDGGSGWTYGRPPSEMTTSSVIFSYILEEDRDKVRADLIPAIEGTGEYRSEFRVLWPDGTTHWILGFGRTVWSFEGKPTGIVGININVTDQKQAEVALLQTEKLAAVGKLASTMAHEINNPLEAVTNLLYLARTSGDIEEAKPYLETADAELRRAAMITSQALRFHKQATAPTLSTFQQLTHELFKGKHSRLKNAGATVEERDHTSHPVLCFEGEIRQVLNNLVTNAIDAFGAKGGALFLRGRDGKDWKTGRIGMKITLADTGSGMSETTQRKLFNAFFTTKGIGGTGLGLWVSKEIIERHKGRFQMRSSQSAHHHGSVFTIFLPYEAATRTSEP